MYFHVHIVHCICFIELSLHKWLTVGKSIHIKTIYTVFVMMQMAFKVSHIGCHCIQLGSIMRREADSWFQDQAFKGK